MRLESFRCQALTVPLHTIAGIPQDRTDFRLTRSSHIGAPGRRSVVPRRKPYVRALLAVRRGSPDEAIGLLRESGPPGLDCRAAEGHRSRAGQPVKRGAEPLHRDRFRIDARRA